MAINKQLLKSHIVKNDGTQAALAKAMGVSLSCLSAKINEADGREFKQSEITFVRDRYKLDEQEVMEIFFGLEVSLIDTRVSGKMAVRGTLS